MIEDGIGTVSAGDCISLTWRAEAQNGGVLGMSMDGQLNRLCLLMALASATTLFGQAKKAPAARVSTGKALYEKRCANCHETGSPRAVSREAMKRMSFENLRFALIKGSMKVQVSGLTREQ